MQTTAGPVTSGLLKCDFEKKNRTPVETLQSSQKQFFKGGFITSESRNQDSLDVQPTCHLSPPPPDVEVVIACFSVSSCFFLFLSTASGFLTPLYVVSFCLFSAASANCRLLVSGSGVTTTSSAAPPKHGRHIPMLELRCLGQKCSVKNSSYRLRAREQTDVCLAERLVCPFSEGVD